VFVVVFLNDTFKLVTLSKLELTSTFAVTNFPIFWSSTGSIDKGASWKVASYTPCAFQPATKFNLIGLNIVAVEVYFNLNLTTINLS